MSTTTQDTIADRVRKILADQFVHEPDEIDLATDMETAYACDSLDVLEITMCVEDEFGLEIPDEPMWAMKTGRQIVDYVTANVKA